MEELKKCPFCGHEIDEQKDLYLPERDWHPTFYDPDSGATLYTYIVNVDWNFRQEHMIMRNF